MMPAVPGEYTQTQDTIRELLADMGCTVVNTEYSRDLSPCCGYGGLTAYANKEMADKMTEKCLERSDSPYINVLHGMQGPICQGRQGIQTYPGTSVWYKCRQYAGYQ